MRPAPRLMDNSHMAIAATVVVLVYATGVVLRREAALWYEWLMAALGAGFAIWFWVMDIKGSRQNRDR